MISCFFRLYWCCWRRTSVATWLSCLSICLPWRAQSSLRTTFRTWPTSTSDPPAPALCCMSCCTTSTLGSMQNTAQELSTQRLQNVPQSSTVERCHIHSTGLCFKWSHHCMYEYQCKESTFSLQNILLCRFTFVPPVKICIVQQAGSGILWTFHFNVLINRVQCPPLCKATGKCFSYRQLSLLRTGSCSHNWPPVVWTLSCSDISHLINEFSETPATIRKYIQCMLNITWQKNTWGHLLPSQFRCSLLWDNKSSTLSLWEK